MVIQTYMQFTNYLRMLSSGQALTSLQYTLKSLQSLIFAGRTLNNLAAESCNVPLSVGIINLVAAPDRKDRRCLLYLQQPFFICSSFILLAATFLICILGLWPQYVLLIKIFLFQTTEVLNCPQIINAFKRQNSWTDPFRKSLTSSAFIFLKFYSQNVHGALGKIMLSVTSRFLSPVSTVFARNAWDHDFLLWTKCEEVRVIIS